MADYRDSNEVEVSIPVPRLVSWHGKYVTWDMLAELGIKGPSPIPKAPKMPKVRTMPVYDPCLRCQKVLGNYAKGFCFPCYKKEKTKQVDFQGRELHPQYHTPPCSYCNRADQRTYQYTDENKERYKDHWFCLDHIMRATRLAREGWQEPEQGKEASPSESSKV